MAKQLVDCIQQIVKFGVMRADGAMFDKDSFKSQHNKTVPLVYDYDYTPILGHALITVEETGVYARVYFDDTEAAHKAESLLFESHDYELGFDANCVKRDNPDWPCLVTDANITYVNIYPIKEAWKYQED